MVCWKLCTKKEGASPKGYEGYAQNGLIRFGMCAVLLEGGGQFRSSLHVQLKSTASRNLYSIGENVITYQLKKKNYDDLRKLGTNEIILCLLVLPEESEKPWVECTDDELLLHGQMYWCSLRNKPDATQEGRVPVELPKDQFLDPNTLDALMLRVAGGDRS